MTARAAKWKKYAPFYVMLLLPVTYFLIFRYLPMLGVVISFKDYDFQKGIWASPWATPIFKHFQTFFESPYCWEVLRNTLLISFYKLIAGVVPPLLLAILLNECSSERLKRLTQTITYMPHFLSWIIVYGICLALFSQTSGLVNRYIVDWGGRPVDFLQSTEYFRSVLIGSSLWRDTGWGAIIYLAAITGIDPTLYEAAKIDGAGRFQTIWHVTIPCISSTILVMLLLKIGTVMNAGFDHIYTFYNIHVYEVADILDTWVYRTGLQQLNFSMGSAVGLFKSLIGLIMIIGANKLANRWGESLW